jgi:Uma2 family endonuclease
MSSVTRHARQPLKNDLPSLANGDRLRQAEFHRRYLTYPDNSKFELIAGTVFMASPLRWAHGRFHNLLTWLIESYAFETPGVEGADNVTTILDDDNEPQPDLALRLQSEYGGKSSITEEGYLQGPPELIVEIAYSSRAIDLHQKKTVYRRTGVKEYLVFAVEDKSVNWFDFHARRLVEPNLDGICKSSVFPGLWLSVPGLKNKDKRALHAALRAGLQSPEHAAFVRRLQARHDREKC